ncbi:MAG: zinc ribbon domain-containing protein [Verrucomicrobiota bacterium]|nr:zinc ribbon domain-containing protein [Verrucomicrobiota bacterium]
MIKLVCPECRRENEPERIYCHDCGARLDRSALAKVAPKGEDPKATHRRLRSLLDPGRAKFRLMFFKISKLVLGACALAAAIQMVLPADVPARVKSAELPPQISFDLENATQGHGGAPLSYTETQVNAYLAGALKSKQAALGKLMQFERALLNFEENKCRITTERSLFGYSFYTATSQVVVLQDGNIRNVSNGGAIGRMPIHPALMKLAEPYLFGDVLAALEREKKLVAKMSAIEFRPQTVVLTPPQ